MEKWEVDYRQELKDTLEDKAYPIGFPSSRLKGWTGKGGQIEFMVAMKKSSMEMMSVGKTTTVDPFKYATTSEAVIRKYLMDIFNGK